MYNDFRIDKITVKAFRGISYESSIDFKDITILCGENGTGKSSFVNAFEYIFSNELDALYGRDVEKDAFIHNGFEKKDVDIEISFANGEVLKLGKKTECPELNEMLENEYIKNASFILNRKNLLRFIDGNTTDKYKAVMDLWGFKKLNTYQSHLSSTHNEIKRELGNKNDEQEERLIKLSQLLVNKQDLSYDSSIDELNKILKRNNYDLIDNETDFSDYLLNLHINPNDFLNDIKLEFDSIFNNMAQNDFDSELKDLLSEYETVVYDNFKSTNDLIDILDKSYDYIDSNKSKKCPICESEINEDVLNKINNNLEILKEQDKEFLAWKNKFFNFLPNLNAFIFDLNDLDENIIKLKSNDSDTNLLNFNFNNERLILQNLYSDLNDLLSTGKKINIKSTLFKDIFEKINLLKENLNKYFEENNDKSDLFIINNALIELDKINDLRMQIATLNSKLSVAKITLETFTSTKEEFINEIIADIKGDIEHFYDIIHEGDEISGPGIELPDPNHLRVYLNSFGEDVDPRSFASEGHLDSLGLCIFLAFNKKFNQIPFIILDDVIATVDMGHKQKIAELLIDELGDYQIFITTHSKLWAEQLKRLTNHSPRKQKSYEIIAWNKEEGPILATPIDSEEIITKYLSPDNYDLNAAGNTARRYLEYILKQICRVNKLEIPYEERPQCESFYSKASSHINKASKGTPLEKYYLDKWDELEKVKFFANILSHDNAMDFDQISYNEVKRFCDAVMDLRNSVICEEHKTFLIFDKSLRILTCSKDKCKLLIDMKNFKFDEEITETNEDL